MKQYIPMTEREVWGFLNNHKILVVATVAPDGRPHNTPVWYMVRGGKIFFRAQGYKMKIRNLAANSWVSCVVEDGDKYTELRGVVIHGKARVVKDASLKDSLIKDLLTRYRKERDTEQMPAEWRKRFEAEPREVVEVTPVKIISWDNRKWSEKK
ncbi:MAG: TIGR03618 family F420-dependent PPOX class oxidoreductase [Thaumarchaeota archaeon]|nr:TIGR03618 family F420-dependent PPOX class oxidoreductase [Nitrososphaerota archaeon]